MRSAAAAKKTVSPKKISSINPDFAATFTALKAILQPYEAECVVKVNSSTDYQLYTQKKIYKGQIYFAGVKQNKNYVSFYLMTVYGSAKQKALISPALQKRNAGKGVFQFHVL